MSTDQCECAGVVLNSTLSYCERPESERRCGVDPTSASLAGSSFLLIKKILWGFCVCISNSVGLGSAVPWPMDWQPGLVSHLMS